MGSNVSFRFWTFATLGALTVLSAAVPASAQFNSRNVRLRSQITLAQFGSSSGAACWGWVSPSGREYALMGLNNKLAVVEITNPDAPVIVGSVSHSSSQWCEVKAYRGFAYVSNETGGGIDVIDLRNVDSGVVTLVQRLTTAGIQTTHTVTLDEVSGFLYTNGANINGGRLIAWDLSDPANPVLSGMMSSAQGGVYVHDSQVVTYTSGPYVGRQIAFCSNGSVALDIVDVTDKNNMRRLSRNTYPNLAYCHQSWLSEDRRYMYVDDELDSIGRTSVFDVSDLSAPVFLRDFSNGLAATDHNLFVRDGFIYEANYRSGLRIWDANDDPVNPVEVGFFDTYPPDDGAGFQGAWHNYPFFPSGIVIIGDINRGLFVVDVTAALRSLSFNFPDGRPGMLDPRGGTTMRVEVTGRNSVPQSGSGMLHVNDGGGWQALAMNEVSENVYDAVFPATRCGAEVAFYVSARDTDGNLYTSPAGAPAQTYTALSAVGLTVVFQDNFQSDRGWTVTNENLTAGAWVRAVPSGSGGSRGDPPTDYDGSGQCFVTGNAVDEDVDAGPTRLTSPRLDLSGGGPLSIRYARWMSNDDNDIDRLTVEISAADGAPGSWVTVESINNSGGWGVHAFDPADYVTPTATVRVRFSVADNPNDSVTEAAIDAFDVLSVDCGPSFEPGDMNCDGAVNSNDIEGFILALFDPAGYAQQYPDCDINLADMNGDGQVNSGDIEGFIAALFGP